MPLRIYFLTTFVCALAASAQSTDQKCTALTSVSQLPNPTTAITSAVLKAASAAVTSPGGPFGRGSIPALPAHCEVRGKMNDRTGANGQHYAINFHMRLPVDWNGKFFFEGGGGSNGNIGDALRQSPGTATHQRSRRSDTQSSHRIPATATPSTTIRNSMARKPSASTNRPGSTSATTLTIRSRKPPKLLSRLTTVSHPTVLTTSAAPRAAVKP